MAINITEDQLADPKFKITPEAVGYRDGKSHCNTCSYFNPATNECDLLEDTVAPLGSCELYESIDGSDTSEDTDDFRSDIDGISESDDEEYEDDDDEDAEEYEEDEEYMKTLRPGKFQTPSKLSQVRPETERERNEDAELEDEAVAV